MLSSLLLALFAGLALSHSNATADFRYGWTIGSSAIDPLANTGPLSPGSATLYLWLHCSPDAAAAALRTEVIINPGNIILAFTPSNPFFNNGTDSSLILVLGGCPTGPVPVGSFLIFRNTPLEICLVGPSWTVDCTVDPAPWPHEALGFKELGNPCGFTTHCEGPVNVDELSWGSIKGVYR